MVYLDLKTDFLVFLLIMSLFDESCLLWTCKSGRFLVSNADRHSATGCNLDIIYVITII